MTQLTDKEIKEKGLRPVSRLSNLTTFFMANPNYMVVQNISFYFFLLMSGRLSGRKLLSPRWNMMNRFALFFILASVVSTFASLIYNPGDMFLNSIKVLPNYIYWGVLIIVVSSTLFRINNITTVYKYITIGVAVTIFNFNMLNVVLDRVPFYRDLQQNAYSFVLIMFTPICTSYIYYRYKNTFYTIMTILLLSLFGFMSGSRSGSLLVLLGGISIFILNNRNTFILSAVVIFYIAMILPNVIESNGVKQLIFNLNPRTYDLVYNTQQTFEEDRSYLTRVAMIQKGKAIFADNPFVGVGLGNFVDAEYEIDFDFVGGEFLEYRSESLARTNPHNSYLSFIAEGGLLLLIAAVLLMGYPIVFFLFNFYRLDGLEKAAFVGVITMCIHAYVITGMVNVYAWYNLAIANAIILSKTAPPRLVRSQPLVPITDSSEKS